MRPTDARDASCTSSNCCDWTWRGGAMRARAEASERASRRASVWETTITWQSECWRFLRCRRPRLLSLPVACHCTTCSRSAVQPRARTAAVSCAAVSCGVSLHKPGAQARRSRGRPRRPAEGTVGRGEARTTAPARTTDAHAKERQRHDKRQPAGGRSALCAQPLRRLVLCGSWSDRNQSSLRRCRR